MRLFKDFLIAVKEITLEYIKSRIFPITILIIALFIALVNRLFTLQIKQGYQYTDILIHQTWASQ